MSLGNFNDLLDDDAVAESGPRPIIRRAGRPKGSKNGGRDDKSFGITEIDWLKRGVTIAWLMEAFGKSRPDVKRLLAEGLCPVQTHSPNGSAKYAIKEACECLLEPRRSSRPLGKIVKAEDLPANLREGFWNAKIKELRYRRAAGELWETKQVMEALGQAFRLIKDHTMTWADTVERRADLTPEQHTTLQTEIDQYLDDIYGALVRRKDTSKTQAYVSQLKLEDDAEDI